MKLIFPTITVLHNENVQYTGVSANVIFYSVGTGSKKGGGHGQCPITQNRARAFAGNACF